MTPKSFRLSDVEPGEVLRCIVTYEVKTPREMFEVLGRHIGELANLTMRMVDDTTLEVEWA